MERSATSRRCERDSRELVRFGLLMIRIALDWIVMQDRECSGFVDNGCRGGARKFLTVG